MHETRYPALALALMLPTLVVPAAISAQEPGPEVFGETVVVAEVLLDVSVTDRGGDIVPGLGVEDFVVTEDGEEVPITSVTYYPHRPSAAPASAADGSLPPLADRFFILFFDDDRLAGSPTVNRQMLDATRWIRQWVENDLAPNDWVAVLAYKASLRVWTDFTNDPGRILAAVDAVNIGDRAFGGRPTRFEGPGPSLTRNLPQGRELERATLRIQDTLATVAEASGVILGRKNLLLFSLGFGRPPEPGFPDWRPDSRYYPRMMETLNDNNVAVYAVDLLPTGAQGSIQDRRINQSLSQLADDTGGAYYFSFVDFRTPLRQIEEASRGYYMLSYSTRFPEGEKGFREVEVEVRGRGLRVEARRGYRYGD